MVSADAVVQVVWEMVVRKMTDNEIIKLYEVCKKLTECRGCGAYDTEFCLDKHPEMITDLINRQKAEIVELQHKIESCNSEIKRLEEAGEEAVSCFTRMETLYKIKCKELEVVKNRSNSVLLPDLKYRQTVYLIYGGKVKPLEVSSYTIRPEYNNLLQIHLYKNGFNGCCTMEDFGKTVFLAKEEAEQALRKDDGNESKTEI